MTYTGAGSFIAIGVLFPLLGALTLGFRLYCRLNKKQNLQMDDLMSSLALLFTTAAGIILIISAAKHNFGYHVRYPETKAEILPWEEKVQFMEKIEFAFSIAQVLALGATKLSILFFYRRIFVGRAFNISNWVLIAMSALWTAIWFFLTIFSCGKHVDYNWGVLQAFGNSCISNKAVLVANPVTDIALDLCIFFQPLPLIWGLHMAWKKKIPVILVFLFGAFSIAAGLTRLVISLYIEVLYNAKAVRLDRKDTLGIGATISFWSYIEIGVAMLVSCLITLGPVSAVSAAQSFMYKLQNTSLAKSIHSKLSRSSGHTDVSLPESSLGDSRPGGSLSSKEARIEEMLLVQKERRLNDQV